MSGTNFQHRIGRAVGRQRVGVRLERGQGANVMPPKGLPPSIHVRVSDPTGSGERPAHSALRKLRGRAGGLLGTQRRTRIGGIHSPDLLDLQAEAGTWRSEHTVEAQRRPMRNGPTASRPFALQVDTSWRHPGRGVAGWAAATAFGLLGIVPLLCDIGNIARSTLRP